MLVQVLLRNELSFHPHNISSSLFSFMNETLDMNVLHAFYMHLCMCTVYVWYYRDQKRLLDLWTLELQVVLSCHVCVGN